MRKILFTGICIVLLAVCTGCEEAEKEISQSFVKDETFSDSAKGYDLPVGEDERIRAEQDLREKSMEVLEIYRGKRETDVEENMEERMIRLMMERLGDLGCIVSDSGNRFNMENYEGLDAFLEEAEAGRCGQAVTYELYSGGGMGRREFSFDGRDMYVLYTVGSWDEEGELWVGESSYTRLKTWRYTQKGWLFYSYCVPEPPEVAEVINTGAMLRVKPRPEEYLKTADRYLRPIGYQGNNLFCSEWSEDHLEELDFNGLFQYLYAVQYGCHMDEEFYREGIPGDVFEELEERYLPVTAEQLRQYAVYDGEKNSYAWKVLGYGNNTAGALGRSVPEITGMVRREDNTVVLTVDAVSGEMCDDAVFSHVLTVRFREDGSVQYLANQIPEAERERIPPYRYRLGASVNSIDDAAL